jgi:hypothetical protein
VTSLPGGRRERRALGLKGKKGGVRWGRGRVKEEREMRMRMGKDCRWQGGREV